MADKTLIGWTDATWNIITGCSMVSAGCTNCYAMGLAGSRLRHHPSRAGLTRETGGRSVWTGELRFNESWLDQPLRWRDPRRIFVCAHGDLFHEAVPDEWIDRVFAVMALCQQHTFQVLTKRPERMREYLAKRDCSKPGDWITRVAFAMNRRVRGYWGSGGSAVWPLPNVWLGTSIEDQATADTRIPHLLATPAAIRFVSAEPLLGLVYIAWALPDRRTADCHRCGSGTNATDRKCWCCNTILPVEPALDLVIVGGESGPRARPMHPDWVGSLRDQCVAAGVAFNFKQWGEWGPLETSEERRAAGINGKTPRAQWHHACGLITDTGANEDGLTFFSEGRSFASASAPLAACSTGASGTRCRGA
ncbi:DUF5131 family protein [Rhodobacter capsulatus]